MDHKPDHESLEKKSADRTPRAALPPCCQTGCTVCVLDYPELFEGCAAGLAAPPGPEPDLAAWLEAIKLAEHTLKRLESRARTENHTSRRSMNGEFEAPRVGQGD
jgi:hypothetical protein